MLPLNFNNRYISILAWLVVAYLIYNSFFKEGKKLPQEQEISKTELVKLWFKKERPKP